MSVIVVLPTPPRNDYRSHVSSVSFYPVSRDSAMCTCNKCTSTACQYGGRRGQSRSLGTHGSNSPRDTEFDERTASMYQFVRCVSDVFQVIDQMMDLVTLPFVGDDALSFSSIQLPEYDHLRRLLRLVYLLLHHCVRENRKNALRLSHYFPCFLEQVRC